MPTDLEDESPDEVRYACMGEGRGTEGRRSPNSAKSRWLARAMRASDEVERRLIASSLRAQEAEEAARAAERDRLSAEHREKVARAEAAGIGGWYRR